MALSNGLKSRDCSNIAGLTYFHSNVTGPKIVGGGSLLEKCIDSCSSYVARISDHGLLAGGSDSVPLAPTSTDAPDSTFI